MVISQETVKILRKLCGALYLEYLEDKPIREKVLVGDMIRVKPDDIIEGGRFVRIYGHYHQLYNEAFEALRSESSLEYMINRDLDEELWHLVCEIILKKSSFLSFQEVIERVKHFTRDIDKPIDEYEVLIPILNLNLQNNIIQLGDHYIKNFDAKSLNEWGLNKGKTRKKIYERFLNRSCLVIREKGNNRNLICNRAREKAYFLIKLLQVSFANSIKIHSYQLLYEIDKGVLCKLVKKPKDISYDWKRSIFKIPLNFDEVVDEDILAFIKKIISVIEAGNINLKFKKSFYNSIIWIGRALEEEDLDIKIIYLSTALESILTTKNDEKKGETIAYRMLLLNYFVNTPFFHPASVLQAYIIRSNVIHGNKLSIATNKDYSNMKFVAIETLDNALSVIIKYEVKNISEFIEIIENQKNNVDQILNWLQESGDKYSIQIRECMIRKLNK